MRFHVVFSAVMLVIAGCGRGEVASDPAAARDSAGVIIVENRSEHGPNLRWEVEALPVVELGRAEGNGPDLFGSVRHVIRLQTGELAVADAIAREVRVFDEGGRHRFTFGGHGEGPGEFTNLWRIAEVRGDSIAVVDNLSGRVSIFTVDGEFSRSYPIPRIPGGSAPNVQGAMKSGALVVSTRATARPPIAGQSTVLVYTVDPQGNISDRLGEYPDRHLGSNGLALGFGGAAVFAVGDSIIWYGHSSRFELRAIDSQGSLVRVIRMDRPARNVTEAEVAEAQAVVRGNLRRQGASGPAVQRIMETEFAEAHPVIGRIVVDDSGYLWVARYTNRLVADESTAQESETWDVFDTDGRLRGQVVLPVGFRVTEITSDLVVGVHTDAMGLHRVLLYRVHRN